MRCRAWPAGQVLVGGDDAGKETALAQCYVADGRLNAFVRQQRADRFEGLDGVPARPGQGLRPAARARGTHPGRSRHRGPRFSGLTPDRRTPGAPSFELGDRGADVLALPQAGQRTHSHGLVGGVPDDDLRKPLGDGGLQVIELLARDEDAANGGALLGRLLGHLGEEALDEDGELRIVRGDVLSPDDSVERVGLRSEADGVDRYHRVATKGVRGLPGTGDRQPVLASEQLEATVGLRAHQLPRALVKISESVISSRSAGSPTVRA